MPSARKISSQSTIFSAQIEAAETGCVEQRKCVEERAAGRDQPYLVAVPHRADGLQHHAAFRIRAGGGEMERSGSQIETVQHHITGQHQCDEYKPDGLHSDGLGGSSRDGGRDVVVIRRGRGAGTLIEVPQEEEQQEQREHRVDSHEAEQRE